MQLTVIQPQFYCGENPDKTIAAFLLAELEKIEEGAIAVLPEYSNAGGLRDKELELKAMSKTEAMLRTVEELAIKKRAYIAINVLQQEADHLSNNTLLYGPDGNVRFVYRKQHIPPMEALLGVKPGTQDGVCDCVCDLDGIRFAFITCFDIYFNEQIEYIARHQPDVIVLSGYQRSERTDILRAQVKLLAYRCNAYVLKASYSMDSDEVGGCSSITSPEGIILEDLGSKVGSTSVDADPKYKYVRAAGFGGGMILADRFVTDYICPTAFPYD